MALVALAVFLGQAPRVAGAPQDDLATVLDAFGLRLAHIKIERQWLDPVARDTTYAGVIVENRKGALPPERVGDAAERLRGALEALSLRKLVHVDVEFRDSTRPARDWTTMDFGLGGGMFSGKFLPEEIRLDKPVEWYARCVCYREYQWQRPTGAPRSVGATHSSFGDWKRADFLAKGNTIGAPPNVAQRVLAVPTDFGAHLTAASGAPLEPEHFFCLLRLERSTTLDESDRTKVRTLAVGIDGVVGTSGKPSLAAVASRAALARSIIERSGIEGLCWSRVEGVRMDRFTGRSQGDIHPLDTAELGKPKAREVTLDVLPAQRLVNTDAAVTWYALVLDHRALKFDVLPSPANQSARAQILRFRKAEGWENLTWVAEGNGEAPADLTNILFFKPRLLK